MNFSQELKKIILSHPVTSKQPPEIVQIHMRHPVCMPFQIAYEGDSKSLCTVAF